MLTLTSLQLFVIMVHGRDDFEKCRQPRRNYKQSTPKAIAYCKNFEGQQSCLKLIYWILSIIYEK